jgi:hypothetical protein
MVFLVVYLPHSIIEFTIIMMQLIKCFKYLEIFMSKINTKNLVLYAILFFVFLFNGIQNSFAAEKFTLSIQDRYAENGTYYVDLYATVPDGVTWTASSQTIIIGYNTNALDMDGYVGVSLANINSSFSDAYYTHDQKQWSPGKMSVNLTKFFPPFAQFSNETFRIATLRLNILDGTLLDDIEILGSECQMLDGSTQLSYNADCDSETCFDVDQPTSQQVALPVPTLDSPADMAMGQALNVSLEWNAVEHDAVDSYDVQVATDDAFGTIVLEDNTTSTSIALTGLDNGTEYYWRVRSSDDDMGITSDWSLPWEFKTMLATPTLASPADGTTGSSLTPTLTWNSVTGAEGYKLYVVDNTGTVIAPIIPSSTSYDVTDGALDYYEDYTWYVVAYESNGGETYESDPSEEWSFRTIVDTPVLTYPADMANGLGTTVNFTWDEVYGAAEYVVEISPVGELGLITYYPTTNSLSYDGLWYCSEYQWRVMAVDADDNPGAFSDWFTFETMPGAPMLSLPADDTKNAPLDVTLEWDAVDCAVSYDVTLEWGEGNSYTENVAGTTFDYALYDYFTDYTWYVEAIDEYGNYGEMSEEWTFRTTLDAPVLTTPADMANGLGTTVDFAWDAVTGASTYTFELWQDGALVNDYTVNTNTHQIAGLDYCSEYSWKVKAVDADDYEGAYSDVFTFETMPGAPMLSLPADDTKNAPLDVTLEWDAVDCAVSYDVTLEWGEGNSYTENVAGTTFDYAMYDYFTDYTWYVEAIDEYGNYGEMSEEWTFRTTLDAPELTTPADMANGLGTTVDFAWDAVTGAFEYVLEIYEDGSEVAELTSNTNSLTWNQLDYCAVYEWKVKAVDADGYEGAYSEVFTFETKPAAPVLDLVADGSVNVPLDATLEWNEVSCAVEYDITIMWGENTYTETVTGTTYDYPNYEYLTDYTWYVVAYDQYGNPSEDSETWSFQTIIEKPAVPVLSTPADMATEVVLTGDVEWLATDRAETYEVQIATDDAFTTIVHNESGISGLTSAYVGLDNDTDHWWRVRASNVGGTSDWSAANEFKTMLLAPPMVTNPTNNEINTLLDFDIEWDDAQGAVAYNLQLSDDPTFATTLYDEMDMTVNTYTVSLDYATTYYLRMQSIDEVDNLSNWEVTTFTTVAEPSFTGVLETCEMSTEIYQAPELDGATYTWTVTGGTYTTLDNRTIEVEFGTYGTANVALAREYGNINDNTDSDVNLLEITYADLDITFYSVYDDACVNEMIDFEFTSTNEDLHTYMWDFGDGSPLVYEMYPSHVFPGAGTYTVTLEVEGDNCTVGTETFEFTVVDDCPITITTTDFTGEDAVCKDETVQMDVDLFGGDGNYTFAWTPASDFFDATIEDATVKSAKVDRTYQLKVTDGNGLYSYGYSEVEVDQGESFTLASIWLPFPTAGTYIDLNSKVTNFDGDYADLVWTNGSTPVSEPDNEEVAPGLSLYYVYYQEDEFSCPSPTKRLIVYGLMGKQIPSDDISVSLEGSAFAYSYPNPVKDVVTLGVEFAAKENAVITVHSLTGQKLQEFTVYNTNSISREIDLTGYSSGMYVIMIDTGNDTVVKRVIKE